MLVVEFTPEAVQEVDDAYRWYETQRTGLGGEFMRCVEEAGRRINGQPFAYALVHGDIRRASVRRFPYGLFYRLQGDRILIVAVVHVRRNWGRWQKR